MARVAVTPPVPAVTVVDHPVPLYNLSSQYRYEARASLPTMTPAHAGSWTGRNWRYSKAELEAIRQELNIRAVERVKSMVEEERVSLVNPMVGAM